MLKRLHLGTLTARLCCLAALLGCQPNGSGLADQVSAESLAVANQYLQVKDLPDFKDALKSFRTMSTKNLIASVKDVPDSLFLRGRVQSGLRPVLAADYANLAKTSFAGDITLSDFVAKGRASLDDLTAKDVERYYAIMDRHLKDANSASQRNNRAMKDLSASEMRRALNAALIIDIISQNRTQTASLGLYTWKFRWSDLTTPGLIAHGVEAIKCKNAEKALNEAKKRSDQAKAVTEGLAKSINDKIAETKKACEGVFPNFACGDNHPENLDKQGFPEPEQCRGYTYQCTCTLTDRNNTPPCNLNWQMVGTPTFLVDPVVASGAGPVESAAPASPAGDPTELPDKCK